LENAKLLACQKDIEKEKGFDSNYKRLKFPSITSSPYFSTVHMQYISE
jgi:hypothetical protein